MATGGSWTAHTDAQQQWRQRQRQEDEQRKKFFQEVDEFPNLFNLWPLFNHTRRARQLLEKQREELTSGWFQYPMEFDRCHNFIVFLLYLVDQKKEALEYCEKLELTEEGDIIRLTNLAVLQWEMGQRGKARKNIATLQELRTSSGFPFKRAVAVSEQGHAFTYFGPKYFLRAIDLLREAIKECHGLNCDIYLWKYDLAIAIRRNFNVFVYREHSSISTADLAEEAWNLLNDVCSHGTNDSYKVRSLVERASLVSTLRQLMKVCKDEESGLARFRDIKHMDYIHKALCTYEGQNDPFVMRMSGRLFMYENCLILAQKYLCKSLEKKKDCIAYQLLAKLHLRKYRLKHRHTKYKSRHPSHETSQHQVPRFPEAASTEDQSGKVSHGGSSLESVQPTYSVGKEGSGGCVPGSHESETPSSKQVHSDEDCSLAAALETSLHIGNRATYGDARTSNDFQVSGHHVHGKATAIRKLLKSSAVATDTYDETDPDVQEAETNFRKALEVDPYNTGLRFDTGRMYQGMNKPEKALEHFKQIICNSDARPMYRVNAYEQSGICHLAISEQAAISVEEKDHHIENAEDMFMSSMRECKKAVRDMPRVSANRAEVWDSYQLIKMLSEKSGENTGVAGLQQMARVHEEVGMYLEAINAHQGILDLSREPQERKEALLGLMRNYCSSNDVTQARAILDVCVDEGHLTNVDYLSCQLCDKAVEVYRLSASQALRTRLTGNACVCFQSALMLMGLVHEDSASSSSPDEPFSSSEVHILRNYDVSIFDDAEDMAESSEDDANKVSTASTALATVLECVFGMSVSRNETGTIPGHLSFEGEQELARTATTVMLVLGHGDELSPRMAFLVDAALRTHKPDRIFPVIIADSPPRAPPPLDHHQPFSDAMELLRLAHCDDTDKFIERLPSHHLFLLRLYDYLLSPVYERK